MEVMIKAYYLINEFLPNKVMWPLVEGLTADMSEEPLLYVHPVGLNATMRE